MKRCCNDDSLFDSVANTVGKGENAGYQHFLLFPQSFLKLPSLGSFKVRIVWQTKRVNSLPNDKILDWSKMTDDNLNIFSFSRNVFKRLLP